MYMLFLYRNQIWRLQKLPIDFATANNQPSAAAAFKTYSSGESEKCLVDTNILCSDSDVSTEHIVCDSQHCAGTTID